VTLQKGEISGEIKGYFHAIMGIALLLQITINSSKLTIKIRSDNILDR
jgi:hypothetical protein